MDKTTFLTDLHSKYEATKNAWKDIFNNYTNDTIFENGDMWDASIKSSRQKENLSCLSVNKISDKIKYIVNNARSNMPSIKVHAISEGASENTAKVFDGIIKAIEYKYNAKQARITAHKTNVVGGLGAWRLVPCVDSKGRYRDIKYERITDPTTVLMDPSSNEQDFSDAEYAFVVKYISKTTFKKTYPDIDIANYDSNYKDWYSDDSVQIVEYWKKDGDKVSFYYVNADNILESNEDYPGKYIPILYLTGSEYSLNGEKDYKGVVRDVKDMQILHNLTKSRTADYIARSAEAQWLAEVEQIADHPMWESSNVNGAPVLLYTGTSSGGKPSRIDPLSPPTGLMESSKESDEDIRRMIGIRDPLADIPGTNSGKAISLQIAQGNIGTFEYIDKLNDLIKYEGRILVDLIPKIYDYPHIREVLGIDGQVTTVQLNKPYIENGEQVMHDLGAGEYLVTINAGPSYDSQRSETSDKLIELVGKYPQFMEVAGDLIVKNMDFVGADELADRLKAGIPPNILAASNPTNGNKPEAMMAQLQAQMAQMAQQLQQMTEQNQQLQQINQQLTQDQQTKATELQLKTQSEMALMQNKAQIEMNILQSKTQMEAQIAKIRMEHEQQMKMLELQASGINLKITGDQKLEQMKVQGDIESQLKQMDNEQEINVLHTESHSAIFLEEMKADIKKEEDRLKAEDEINKLHVQNHAEIFLAQMKAEIEMDVKEKTGIDLID